VDEAVTGERRERPLHFRSADRHVRQHCHRTDRADHAHRAAVVASFRHAGETSTCDHHIFRCGVPVLRVIYDCGTAIRDAWSSCCVSLSVSARFIATDNSFIRYAAVLVVFLQISP
jgi:hypothetical protein